MKTVPPGFESGMNFGTSDVNLNLATALKPKTKKEEAPTLDIVDETDNVIDLGDLLKEKESIFKWISEEPLPSSQSTSVLTPFTTKFKRILRIEPEEPGDMHAKSTREEFDDLPVVDISKVVSLSEQKMKSTEWAEVIDVSLPLDNYDDLVPNPAFTWPFELDRFQKHVRL